MAEGQGTRARPSSKRIVVSNAQISAAQRAVLAFLRREFPSIDDPEDVAASAVASACMKWREEAPFEGYAIVLARYEALDALRRRDDERIAIQAERHALTVESSLVSKGEGETEPPSAVPRGARLRIARVLGAFLDEAAVVIEDTMFLSPSATAQTAQHYVADLAKYFAANGEGCPWRPSMNARFEHEVATFATRCARLGPQGWTESFENVDERPRTVGRPAADRFERAAAEHPNAAELFLEQRKRLALLAFAEKRRVVARGIVTYALKRAGVPGKELNEYTKLLHQEQERARAAERADLLEALRAARDEVTAEDNSDPLIGHESQGPCLPAEAGTAVAGGDDRAAASARVGDRRERHPRANANKP